MLKNHVGLEEREYGKVKGGKDGLCQAAVQAFIWHSGAASILHRITKFCF